MWEAIKLSLSGRSPTATQMPIEASEKETLLTRSALCFSKDPVYASWAANVSDP